MRVIIKDVLSYYYDPSGLNASSVPTSAQFVLQDTLGSGGVLSGELEWFLVSKLERAVAGYNVAVQVDDDGSVNIVQYDTAQVSASLTEIQNAVNAVLHGLTQCVSDGESAQEQANKVYEYLTQAD